MSSRLLFASLVVSLFLMTVMSGVHLMTPLMLVWYRLHP